MDFIATSDAVPGGGEVFKSVGRPARPPRWATVYGTYTAGQLSNGGVVYINLDLSLLNAGDGTYKIALVSTTNSMESAHDSDQQRPIG